LYAWKGLCLCYHAEKDPRLLERGLDKWYPNNIAIEEYLQVLPQSFTDQRQERIELDTVLLLRDLLYTSGGGQTKRYERISRTSSDLSAQDIIYLYSISFGLRSPGPKPFGTCDPFILQTLSRSKMSGVHGVRTMLIEDIEQIGLQLGTPVWFLDSEPILHEFTLQDSIDCVTFMSGDRLSILEESILIIIVYIYVSRLGSLSTEIQTLVYFLRGLFGTPLALAPWMCFAHGQHRTVVKRYRKG